MTIVKRLVKGSELTHAELDGNFTDLDERVGTLELGGGGGGGGKILQVLSVTKRDVFTTTATTFADITGLSLTITPSSDTSKILVFANVVSVGASVNTLCFLRIERAGNAFIGAGDAAGVRVRTSGVGRGMYDANGVLPSSFSVLDAPNTTLPMTYKVTAYGESGAMLRINASANDTDHAISGHRSISTLTLMEVAA